MIGNMKLQDISPLRDKNTKLPPKLSEINQPENCLLKLSPSGFLKLTKNAPRNWHFILDQIRPDLSKMERT